MEDFCRREGIRYFPYRKGFSVNPLVGLRLRRVCRHWQPDLLHTHDSHAHTFAYLAALMGNQTPIVVSRRVDFPIGKSRFSLRKYHHPCVRKVLCVSQEIQRILLQDYQHPDQTAVVYSGIDLEKFPDTVPGTLHKELGISPETLLIGNVAALAPHKDYFTFVDTVEQLVRLGFTGPYLIIGGDGGEQAAIESYVQQKDLTKVIRFLGYRNDIPDILPELDILLFTSKTEGLGTTLLDAQACGTAIVATRAGGIPEVIEDEDNGLLAPVGDAPILAQQVVRLLEDPDLRARLIESGRERVKAFSKQETARQTRAQYQAVVSPGRSDWSPRSG
jgi:glycosyltransferase involved in cell wall biosynthesis